MNYVSYLLFGSLCLFASQSFAMEVEDEEMREAMGGLYKLAGIPDSNGKDAIEGERAIENNSQPLLLPVSMGTGQLPAPKPIAPILPKPILPKLIVSKPLSSPAEVPWEVKIALLKQRRREYEIRYPNYPWGAIENPYREEYPYEER